MSFTLKFTTIENRRPTKDCSDGPAAIRPALHYLGDTADVPHRVGVICLKSGRRLRLLGLGFENQPGPFAADAFHPALAQLSGFGHQGLGGAYRAKVFAFSAFHLPDPLFGVLGQGPEDFRRVI